MLQILDENILEFMECFYDPIAFSEATFTDFDTLSALEEGSLGEVRVGQFPLLSYETTLLPDDSKDDKENFHLMMGAGNSYTLGGRNFGKTISNKLDMIYSLTHLDGFPMGITSYDALHIRGVLEPVIDCLDNHPILTSYKKSIKRSPTYYISTKNNAVIEGINMNLSSKSAGDQFFQKHLKKIFVEEASFENDEVYRKRIDSRHELGCIEKSSGMCNFTKYSPCGRIFYDRTKRPWVINLPQYINPNWDNKEKEKAIKKHGGENSVGYRIFVKGEVVEEGVSVFDMERIRPFYKEGRKLKKLEINKKSFIDYEMILRVLERPDNSEAIYICADIGESAPTEIIILSKVDGIYKFSTNITLYGLTDKEQYKIFKYLGQKLNANVIGLDTTDGTGRAIYRSLEEVFPRESLVWVQFNRKIAVGFDKNEHGVPIFKDGKPQYIEEYIPDWSIKHLKTILYDGKIEIPEDSYKFDSQINSVISMQSGLRVVYNCTADEDHLFQAFQVFSIADWNTAFLNIRPITTKRFCKTRSKD